MTFVKIVLQELHCPRCNAIAQLRIEEERDKACLVYIVCNKCRLRQFHSITSRKAITLMGIEQKLLRQLDSATEQSKSQIRGRLARIRKQIAEADLGLGG